MNKKWKQLTADGHLSSSCQSDQISCYFLFPRRKSFRMTTLSTIHLNLAVHTNNCPWVDCHSPKNDADQTDIKKANISS